MGVPPYQVAIRSSSAHPQRPVHGSSRNNWVYWPAPTASGTLFGNGERTGNLDIVAVALNLACKASIPRSTSPDLNSIREVRALHWNDRPARQPCRRTGLTAFSGSHRDAIKKGVAEWAKNQDRQHWDVPYPTIDPTDIGREYREVIRVTQPIGQSGVAYPLESESGILPQKPAQFGPIANDK